MNATETTKPETTILKQNNAKGFFWDLIIYISVMFLIREIYFENLNFIANGLFWSLSTLVVATWRMKARGVTWKELGLSKPESFEKTIIATVITLVLVVGSIVIFDSIKDQLPFLVLPDTSESSAVSKFGDLKGNLILFLTIIPFIWIESFLEELLDRGFLMNWIERMFSKTSFATVFAVILQAVIFGFRHSQDLSERSITVGLVGLAMGISYIAFKRNLWPLIIAHAVLNTMSMIGRL